jgi:predicted O-methyltransferase YrrM
MLRTIKQIARNIAPGLYESARMQITKYGRLTRALGDDLNWTVATGPFRGMRYPDPTCGILLPAKLLGSYEQELHPWITSLLEKEFSHVVDIGCAEGFYAVGLARCMPASTVLAFDTSEKALALCATLARHNEVLTRIRLYGECTVRALRELTLESPLVFSDCEGSEFDLLDPVQVQWLRSGTIVVETHECFRPGVTEELTRRFRSTHSISMAREAARDPSVYTALEGYASDQKALALGEFRNSAARAGGQQWLFMEPRLKRQ